MKKTRGTRVSTEVVPWRTTINSVPHTIDIPVYHSGAGEQPVAPTLNLNGVGEGKFSASVAPRLFDATYSPVLPFEGELDPTPANMERISEEVPPLIAEFALKHMGSNYETVRLLARSQGGAPGIRAARVHPELFDQLALVMPFGLTTDKLGDTIEQRRREVFKRLTQAAFKANMFDIGNMRTTAEVIGYAAKAAAKKTLLPAFDAGLSFDMRGELEEVADRIPVAVFASKGDPMFPYDELAPVIERTDAQLIELRGTHATPGSRQGKRNLQAAYEWLHSDQESSPADASSLEDKK